MRTGIFSFRAFDRRLARLAAPISSGVRQGGRICPPSGARSAEYPSGARVKDEENRKMSVDAEKNKLQNCYLGFLKF